MRYRARPPWKSSVWLLLLSARAPAQEARLAQTGERVHVAFEGFVLAPDGTPAEGAVIVSSAGGRAVADRSGRCRLEVRVPLEAESVRITAVSGASTTAAASTSAGLPFASGLGQVDPLFLGQGDTCRPNWMAA